MRRALAALWLIGCAGSPEPSPVIASEHFRVHAEAEVCPEITGWLEHYAQRFERIFGVESPVIDYELFADSESLAGAGCSSLGCGAIGSVRSIFPVHAHELVHSIAGLRGQPPHVLSEGLASVFGCQPSEAPAIRSIDPALVAEILDSEGFDAASGRGAETYAVAASLVRHLLDRFGDEAVLELYAGVELGAEIDRWLASPPERICRRDVECSMFEVPAGVPISAELMCGRLGSPAELALAIALDEPSAVSLSIDGPIRDASIGACEGGPSAGVDGPVDGVVELGAGRYWLLVRGGSPGDRVDLRWQPEPR